MNTTSGLISVIIFPITFLMVSTVFILIDGTIKKGWLRVGKRMLKSLIFSCYWLLANCILRFAYPALPDFWKLVGTGVLFVLTLPLVALWFGISESIYEDRKEDLFVLGWREAKREDFKSWDDYLVHHTTQIYHQEYGILDVSKAEKIMKGK